MHVHLGQFTRDDTQTEKQAAGNKRAVCYRRGSIQPVLLWGNPKGTKPLLAHDFANDSPISSADRTYMND